MLPLLPEPFARADLAPLPEPDLDRLLAHAAALEGVGAARLTIRVAPRRGDQTRSRRRARGGGSRGQARPEAGTPRSTSRFASAIAAR